MKPAKSGATKRKEAAAARDAINKLPKLTTFFKATQCSSSADSEEPEQKIVHPNPTSTNKGQVSISEEICNKPLHPLPSLPSFTPVPNDPASWPEQMSDSQRCDIVKRGPQQIDTDFPYNTARRRFSIVHYKRGMNNGETVSRSWLVYSVESDKAFCFCCKLFGKNESQFCSGTNTWEGLSKKLNDDESATSHQKCFSQWIQLQEGILNESTVDKKEMQLFLKEKQFWGDVLERLIDIVMFLSERNIAFRGSEEVLGSANNGNFLKLFELLAKRDPVLNELHNRITRNETQDHYLSNTIQNELIQLLAAEVEKENLRQLKLAKYFAIILDCTPDVSHQEQLTVILRYVQCDPGKETTVREVFFGYLRVNDSSGKGLLDIFLEQAKDLQLNLSNCRGQSYDNGANMKGKQAGVQSRVLKINPKALYVPCANHSLNLVVVDSTKSSTKALTFFGVLTRLYTIFSASTQRWSILKANVHLSIKSQSDIRWESRINCIKPLRYYLADVLKALEQLEEFSIEKKDGTTASEARSLITQIASWSFILSVIIWYDILFQINTASKTIQSYGISLDVMENEIKVTETFLENYPKNGYTSAVTTARELAEDLDIARVFPPIRTGRKKKMFDYEAGDESSNFTPEYQFKRDFFLQLMDHALQSVKDRFQQMHDVADVFSFLFTQENLISAFRENSLLTKCQNFQKKMGDIDPFEMEMELKRFVQIVMENKESLKTAYDFLNYISKKRLQEMYANVSIALRILLTCPVTVASAERSFSKLKLIKTFHRSTMMDDRLSSLAMLSIERDCARTLKYDHIIDAFADRKTRRKPFH